jgi:hypothetical protein
MGYDAAAKWFAVAKSDYDRRYSSIGGREGERERVRRPSSELRPAGVAGAIAPFVYLSHVITPKRRTFKLWCNYCKPTVIYSCTSIYLIRFCWLLRHLFAVGCRESIVDSFSSPIKNRPRDAWQARCLAQLQPNSNDTVAHRGPRYCCLKHKRKVKTDRGGAATISNLV